MPDLIDIEALTDDQVVSLFEALKDRYTAIKEGELCGWAKDIGLGHLLPQN